MRRILFRYTLLEVAGPFAIGMMILTFVLLMFQLLKLTELIVSYGVELADVGRILLCIFPSFFTFTIPMSFLLAVLLAVNRFSSDSELTAMKAGGLSLYQLYPPILVISVLATLATAGLALFGDPWGKSSFKKMLVELGREKATVGLVEHVFNDSLKNMTLYIHHLMPEEDRMEGVFLADERQRDSPLIIVAKEGRLRSAESETDLVMEFADGVAHHVDPKDRSIYETIQFVRYKVRVDLSRAAGPASAEETYLEKDMWELAEHVRHLRAKGDSYDARRAWVEFHRRFAMPFVCLAFGLIGLPLGVSPPRTGRSRGFTTSIGVLCMFYLLFRAGENLGWKGVLHPIVAMWTPIALLLALGGYLLVKKAGERPIWALDLAFELAGRAAEWLRARLGWSKPEDTQHP